MKYNDFNHCDFHCYAFCFCVVEYEDVVLTARHKFFSLCKFKLGKLCHMYGFCLYIRKGKLE